MAFITSQPDLAKIKSQRSLQLLAAYLAPLLRLIFKWTALMCLVRSLTLPNATPLQ